VISTLVGQALGVHVPAAAVLAQEGSGPSGGEQFTFWFAGTLAVVGALGLVLSRRAVHSALFMALTMMNLAVLYAANGAPFLALVQVIVYTGAVMMMFLFVLMIVGVDASDSFVETIKGQRVWSVVLVLGFGVILIGAVGAALSGVTSVGVQEANTVDGGNVQGLARLIFTRYLLAFQVVAALLITAALGALVLAHRERTGPRQDQRTLSEERFRSGGHAGVLPSPGVFATTNAIGTPALLPDGTPSQESIPYPLRGPGEGEAPDGDGGPDAISGDPGDGSQGPTGSRPDHGEEDN